MNKSIKIKPLYLAILLAIFIAVCIIIGIKMNAGGDVSQVNTWFTVTDDHSAKDIEAAMRAVRRFFRAEYTGCTLTDLWYEGEAMSAAEDSWADQYDSRDAIVLLSSLQTDDLGSDSSLEQNRVYTNYQWILVKNPLGQWSLKTWGYG